MIATLLAVIALIAAIVLYKQFYVTMGLLIFSLACTFIDAVCQTIQKCSVNRAVSATVGRTKSEE